MDNASVDRGIHFFRNERGWEFRSYAELAGQAGRVAAFLVGQGARPGDVVSLLLSEVEDFVPAFLGTMLAGLTPSPIASPVTFQGVGNYSSHVADIVRTAGSALLLADAELAEVARQAVALSGRGRTVVLGDVAELPEAPLVRRPEPDVALLQFTSGSSGTPKGVQVSPENLAGNVRAIHGWLGITPEDSCSSWLPMYHDMGLVGTFLGSVVAQIDLWLMTPLEFIRSPLRWIEAHGSNGVTVTTAPNFGYAYAARRVRPDDLAGMDFSRWRVAMNGAERIVPKAASDFAALLGPHGFRPEAFAPCYGLAESTLAVTGVRPGTGARAIRLTGGLRTGEPVRVIEQGTLGDPLPEDGPAWLTSCGAAVPGAIVDVVDEEGAALPDGTFGEIRVRGTSVALGYRSLQEGASSNFTPDGLHTGDSGFLLDGELYVVGRVGDSLKIRGRRVHAEDVEAGLTAVPGVPVGRCAVALGGSEQAHRAVLLVEAAGDQWLAPALGVLRSVLDGSVEVTVVRVQRGGIPRTSSGKPRRRLIWRQFQDGEVGGDVLHGELATAAPAV
ncbi:AMP-binding protein [Kitasatospora sp. NPDC088346]|uniref:AMP-binding protein n=1 Tax=Kitasatospora sp. NPDC088346 TaxID=3364073 RepID=UPI00382F46D0